MICQQHDIGMDNTGYRPTLKVYGKSVVQSRAIAAYATSPTLTIKYSGQTIDMHYPYPPLLARIQHMVERALGMDQTSEDVDEIVTEASGEETFHGFNHVMLNRYDDGSVYIGRHRDYKENKVCLIEVSDSITNKRGNQVIASLSLGAERTFIMTPDPKNKQGKAVKWVLKNGSLLIMQGDTQTNWKVSYTELHSENDMAHSRIQHEIPKEAKVKDGRISLTFRQVV